MNAKFLLFGTVAMLCLASCTAEFKHKMEVADKYIDDMSADNVVCGTASETNNGQSMSMTTLKFTGCSSHIDEIEREWAVNKVAKEFYGEMTEKDIEGETHLKITAETKGSTTFDFIFPLSDLKRIDEFTAICNEAMEACVYNDTAAIDALKDDEMMPDEEMYQIYNVMAYNDSLYEGDNVVKDMMGYRFAEGENDPDLKLFSVDYDVTGTNYHTRYTINIDRETNKVVYIWLKTM